MKTVVTEEHTECDMCKNSLCFQDSFIINGHKWDICSKCADDLERVLSFLTVTVGVAVDYRHL